MGKRYPGAGHPAAWEELQRGWTRWITLKELRDPADQVLRSSRTATQATAGISRISVPGCKKISGEGGNSPNQDQVSTTEFAT